LGQSFIRLKEEKNRYLALKLVFRNLDASNRLRVCSAVIPTAAAAVAASQSYSTSCSRKNQKRAEPETNGKII